MEETNGEDADNDGLSVARLTGEAALEVVADDRGGAVTEAAVGHTAAALGASEGVADAVTAPLSPLAQVASELTKNPSYVMKETVRNAIVARAVAAAIYIRPGEVRPHDITGHSTDPAVSTELPDTEEDEP